MNPLAVAIDIGGSSTKIALVNIDGVLHPPRVVPTDVNSDPADFLALVVSHVSEVIKDAGVTGVGVSIAGFIDSAHSRLVYNPNLAFLENFPLASSLEQRLALPVVLEVDSNAASLAEHRMGAGRGVSRLLVVTIGTGLGGGMIINGQLLRFAGECLGDIGHIIVQPGSDECSAGCHGCAEAMVSADAVERLAGGGRTTKEVIQAAGSGDRQCIDALHVTGEYLGIAMASWSATFLPERILVAGGVSEAGPLLLDPAIDSFRRTAGAFYRDHVTIASAETGWRAPLLGAAVPVLEGLAREPQFTGVSALCSET